MITTEADVSVSCRKAGFTNFHQDIGFITGLLVIKIKLHVGNKIADTKEDRKRGLVKESISSPTLTKLRAGASPCLFPLH